MRAAEREAKHQQQGEDHPDSLVQSVAALSGQRDFLQRQSPVSVRANQLWLCEGLKSMAARAGALPTNGGLQAQRAGLLVLDQMRAGCG